jgi:hypothetical protein
VLVAPAMNTHMWEHPFTEKHLGVLKGELGYRVVDPVAKLLACGDRGEWSGVEWRARSRSRALCVVFGVCVCVCVLFHVCVSVFFFSGWAMGRERARAS